MAEKIALLGKLKANRFTPVNASWQRLIESRSLQMQQA
jgi:hypothetical protein